MPGYPPVNLQVQRPYRARLHPGDIFTMQIPDGHYVFGRVVRTDAACFGPKCTLVYVFRYLSRDATPPERLLVTDLLIPPATINRLGWSRGYMVTVANRAFGEGERMPVHYFRDSETPKRFRRRRFLDEDHLPVGRPPRGTLVGGAGLGNYRTLDDAISRALGIPLAPEPDPRLAALLGI